MVEKNWLIRTRNNHLLGPVTKVKVVELIRKKSLHKNDELSSGNGYWFKVAERDLLDKYIFGDIPQSFNPISEAKTVLAIQGTSDQTSSYKGIKKSEKKEERSNFSLPSDNDLEYPDLEINEGGESKEENEEKQEKVINEETGEETSPGIHVEKLIQEAAEKSKAIEDAKAKEEQGDQLESKGTDEKKLVQENNKTNKKESVEDKSTVNSQKIIKNDKSEKLKEKKGKYLFILLFLLVVAFLGLHFYFKTVLNKNLFDVDFFNFISSANAQESYPIVKKKVKI